MIGTSQGAAGFAGDATSMTSLAFERQFSWFPYPLALAAVLSPSTMIAWSYYGLKGGAICSAKARACRRHAIFCASSRWDAWWVPSTSRTPSSS